MAKKGSAAPEKGLKMVKVTNEHLLKEKIEKFAYESIEFVNQLSIQCFAEEESVYMFYKKILDLYINNRAPLYNLNGFLEDVGGATPFLGKSDLQDPCEFTKKLGDFIGNCLLDDASYYILWLKNDKKPRVVAGMTLNLPYRNGRGEFVSIPCEPFDKEGNPVIIADYSGNDGGQDVDYLNKVVDFAINKEAELQKRIKNLPGFKNGQL